MPNRSLWLGEAGRKKFTLFWGITSAVIFALPFAIMGILKALSRTDTGGALGLVVSMLLPLALLLIAVPGIIVTRQRLRMLGMPGIFLLPFPILPLLKLGFNPLVSVTIYGIGVQPLFLAPEILTGLVFALFLALTPGKGAAPMQCCRFLAKLRDQASENLAIDRGTFVKIALTGVAAIVALDIGTWLLTGLPVFQDAEKPIQQMMRDELLRSSANPGISFVQMLWAVQGALQACIVFALLAPVVRRLKGLRRGQGWAILFPVFFGSAVTLMSGHFHLNPYAPYLPGAGIPLVLASASVITLLWLVSAKDKASAGKS